MARYVAILAAVVVGLPACVRVAGATPFDVYVVAVGSSRYGEPTAPDANGLPRIYGANKSARAIATRLLSGGAKKALLITAPEGTLISSNDVYRAIDAIATRIRADKPHNALLVYYFAGHGISEGVGWSHFAVPGTFAFHGSLPALGIEAIAAATVPTADVVARLDKLGVRYLALIDTCYEGKPAAFLIRRCSPDRRLPACSPFRACCGS